jgi:hypothetical protein
VIVVFVIVIVAFVTYMVVGCFCVACGVLKRGLFVVGFGLTGGGGFGVR